MTLEQLTRERRTDSTVQSYRYKTENMLTNEVLKQYLSTVDLFKNKIDFSKSEWEREKDQEGESKRALRE